ncbi:methyltransferase domain-containing protein [Paenibacillus sp. GCM10027626]|uniref:methyltransferase domain-containing protein n=1 Tax=Paenibacillus sp. GCM10027626 TaxID=3273411 RepID=UPI00362C4131
MAHYLATVLPGLEFVLKDEIGVKIADADYQGLERGKVHFSSKLPLEALMVLRTADNLYRPIHKFQVGPHKIHLAEIEQEILKCDLSCAYLNGSGMISYKVNASRVGKHSYSRFDAAEAAARGIARRSSRFCRSTAEMHEIEFRLDINCEDAVFSLRLTDASFRYRQQVRMFTQAALRPTVAHALVWFSHPEETDVFIDPFCGSGTILFERLSYPYSRMDGGDLSQEAVEASKQNIGCHDHVGIHRWDARQLPFASGEIDKIVTNLPFGRQIAADEDIFALYCDSFREMKRVLSWNGSIVCLTDAGTALKMAAERIQLNCSEETTLSLKGLHPAIFLLKKS